MKLKNLVFVVFLILIFCSCKKSNESNADYAVYIAGIYKGIVNPGQLNGTVILIWQSRTSVNIDFSTSTGDTLHYLNASVSNDGSGKILISLTSSNNTIYGNVNVTTLDCNINQFHFLGTKQ